MTLEEFEQFVETEKSHIEWSEDNDHFYFRDLDYSFYRNNANRSLRVNKDLVKDLTIAQLREEIGRGLNVENITRITGYFAKTNSWNPGKRAELRDRMRKDIESSDK
ncbi:MAG TPA: anaerobic ribonucleoside-triphosphate reductase [Thermodesulfobacteriota bacterium]|nr:anaerobic ribonucleoside-triphosphate reductase [Thermodesulfobacteriota bacterium]